MNLIIKLTLLLVSSVAFSEPLNLVSQYVKLDYAGARLSSDTYRNVSSLTSWEEEPGWDSAVVVSSYKVEPTSDGVAVTYTTHGFCPGGMSESAGESTVIFKTTESDSGLLIAAPMIRPHVSAELMCEKFKQCCLRSM